MIRRLFEKLKLIKQRQSQLAQSNVMRSCYTEVWQKWCELDIDQFDAWLYKKMHDR